MSCLTTEPSGSGGMINLTEQRRIFQHTSERLSSTASPLGYCPLLLLFRRTASAPWQAWAADEDGTSTKQATFCTRW